MLQIHLVQEQGSSEIKDPEHSDIMSDIPVKNNAITCPKPYHGATYA